MKVKHARAATPHTHTHHTKPEAENSQNGVRKTTSHVNKFGCIALSSKFLYSASAKENEQKLFNFMSVSDGHTVLEIRPTTLLNNGDKLDESIRVGFNLHFLFLALLTLEPLKHAVPNSFFTKQLNSLDFSECNFNCV